LFWNDIKINLVKCLDESLDIGKVSTSQRPGLITCILKEGNFISNKTADPLPYYV
jgi:hypothetical protein